MSLLWLVWSSDPTAPRAAAGRVITSMRVARLWLSPGDCCRPSRTDVLHLPRDHPLLEKAFPCVLPEPPLLQAVASCISCHSQEVSVPQGIESSTKVCPTPCRNHLPVDLLAQLQLQHHCPPQCRELGSAQHLLFAGGKHRGHLHPLSSPLRGEHPEDGRSSPGTNPSFTSFPHPAL